MSSVLRWVLKKAVRIELSEEEAYKVYCELGYLMKLVTGKTSDFFSKQFPLLYWKVYIPLATSDEVKKQKERG